MERPIFPSKNMRITQGYHEGSHKDSFAIDNADKDSGISNIYAPFTGVIKKIYKNDANEVWLESVEPVEYPDGTIDYMTVLFAHDNQVDDLFVGKRVSQNEVFYQEGTKGNATGNHCHIECGRGKFIHSGWHKNNAGYWSINNGKKPEECLWLDDSIQVLDSHGYSFKRIPIPQAEPPAPIKEKEPVKVEVKVQEQTKKSKSFIAPKTDLYGIYLKEKQKIIIEDLSQN